MRGDWSSITTSNAWGMHAYPRAAQRHQGGADGAGGVADTTDAASRTSAAASTRAGRERVVEVVPPRCELPLAPWSAGSASTTVSAGRWRMAARAGERVCVVAGAGAWPFYLATGAWVGPEN